MRKIKISNIATALVVFLMFFVSCTNEELVPNEPDGPVLNQGRVVFNVNTGKSMVCTRASKEDEQAIRSLGVFIVKPDGNLAEGVTRFYESQVLTGNKLAVSIPVDIMETPGVKAYLVANGPNKAQCDGLKTEQEVLGLVATTKPEEISTKGIPMASGAISLNFTGGIATVDANMKRVMSTLCAKVIKSKGVVVGPSDFTFKVHGVSGKEGYCFKDECKDTGVEQVWNSTSKSQDEEVSLGYFYQSKKFQVEVISQSTAQSRTVEIPLEKAQTRNKKYVLKIHPKPISEGKGEFTVTVEAWEETECDVNFGKDLIVFAKCFMRDGELWLDDELLYSDVFRVNFLDGKNVADGYRPVGYELIGCLDEQKRGVILGFEDPGNPLSAVILGTEPRSTKEIKGKLICTLESENGIRSKSIVPIRILPPFFYWREGFKQKTDDASFKVIDGKLVCTIINDSARGLSVDAKVLQDFVGSGVKEFGVDAEWPVSDPYSQGYELEGALNGSEIKFTFDKSFKGYAAEVFLRSEKNPSNCCSHLLVVFE